MSLISTYKEGDMAAKLIFINSAVFLFMCVLMLIDKFASTMIMNNTEKVLAFSSNISDNLVCPWKWITYMFLHNNFIHYIINMLLLSFAGKLFLEFWGDSDLLCLYIFGGLLGALSFAITCLLLNHYTYPLCGASASVMALIFASATYTPNYEVRLTLIGYIKIKWITVVFLAISAFNMLGSNWLGEISHLGGVIGGILFAYLLKTKSINITAWINKIIDFFNNLFKREKKPKMKLYRNPNMTNGGSRTTGNPTFTISTEEELLDSILEKIKKSGFDSLTDKEKAFLDGYGKRN